MEARREVVEAARTHVASCQRGRLVLKGTSAEAEPDNRV